MNDYFDRVELELRAAVVREANPVSDALPPAPIEPLLRRLDEQLQGVPQGSPRTRRSRRDGIMSAVGTTAAVGSAIAVAAVAVIVIGRNRAAVQPSAAGSAGVRQLVSVLAILRRPQTSADRTLPAGIAQAFDSFGDRRRIVPSYTRLGASLRTRSGVARVFVIVRKPGKHVAAANHKSSVNGLDEVWAITVLAGGSNAQAGVTVLDQPWVVSAGDAVNQSLVPDGVARVRWVFNGRSSAGRRMRRPVTIYPAVRDNVAIAPQVRRQGQLSAATWYDTEGRVIASYGLH